MLKSSFLMLSLFFSGCATFPFEPAPKADFQGLEPAVVVTDFGASVGQEFELLESVVFNFFTKSFTGLGYLSIDPADGSYALSCMTPSGISILGLKGSGEEVEALFVPPPMENHQDKIIAAIGRDLCRTYLDWVPPAGAIVKHKSDRMIFTAVSGDETVAWTFSGPQKLLTEKRFYKGWKTRGVVRYFDYEKRNGKLYPMGVVLCNKSFHYRMTFRVKEVYPVQASE